MFGPPESIVAHSFGAQVAFAAFAGGGPGRLALVAPAIRPYAMTEGFARMLALSPSATRRFVERIDRYAGPQILPILRGEGDVPGSDVRVFHDPADTRTPFADAERFAHQRSGARIVAVEDVGHHRILEHPEVVAAIAGFVAGSERSMVG
jgi:pimeloyl-ACP methyl ester carboxylesterase